MSQVLEGFFDTFAHALGADLDGHDPDPFYAGEIPDGGLTSIDSARLTLAGYTPSRYRYDNDFKPYEAQIAGLLRSGLLKRFESSGYAFVRDLPQDGRHPRRPRQPRSPPADTSRQPSRCGTGCGSTSTTPPAWRNGSRPQTTNQPPSTDRDPLLADIRSDITLLRSHADTVDASITPGRLTRSSQPWQERLPGSWTQADSDAHVRAAAGQASDPAR